MPDAGPVVVDFDLWRGSNLPPVIWGLENEDGTPFPVAGSEFVLTIRWAGGSIRKSTAASDGFALDAATSELAWSPTLAETRLVPLGRLSRYEVERRIGGHQDPLITGSITGKGGNNDD